MADQKYAIIGIQECYDVYNANEKLDLGIDADGKTEEQIADEAGEFSKKFILAKLKEVAKEKEADIGGLQWEREKNDYGVYWRVLFSEYLSTPIDEDESPYQAFLEVDLTPHVKLVGDCQGNASIRASRTPRGKIID